MTQVTTEKLYQHRPKAQGITFAIKPPKPFAGIILPIHRSCRICWLHCLRLFPSVSSSLYIACAMYVTKWRMKICKCRLRHLWVKRRCITFYSASRLFLQDRKRVCRSWVGISLGCIYWRRCLCNYCLNICLTTKPTSILQILITANCWNTGKLVW